MLDLAVNLCKNVIDILISEKKLDQTNKEILSQTLFFISEVLEDTAIALKTDRYPHMNCDALNSLSERLMGVLSNHMGEEDAIYLVSVLREASEVEKQFSLRKEPETIPIIERAAGEFKSMGILANL